MSNYVPDLSNMIPLVLLKPSYESKLGVATQTYPSIAQATLDESNIFFGTFKTYGGTERDINDVYSIKDTANVECYFRPDIKADCRVGLENGAIYEIINEPENINQRNQFMKFKLSRVKGGA